MPLLVLVDVPFVVLVVDLVELPAWPPVPAVVAFSVLPPQLMADASARAVTVVPATAR
jgi:hypothetical protein